MKKIIATTALALMMTTSSFAASHMAPIGTVTMQEKGDVLASTFIGMRVYATENAVDTNTAYKAGSEKEWDDIGEVNDVVLGADGTVKAVILGVGGFLGIGEKDVSVTMDQIKMVTEEGNANDFFLVVNANKETLEAAPTYKRMTSTGTMSTTDTAATKPAAETTGSTAMSDRTMLERPAIQREGYTEAKAEELTASDLEGARVYGSNDEDVGEINRLLLDDKGQIKEAVLDIGGFLGMGEHPIAVTLSELNIQRDANGGFKVFIDATKEKLEKQPAYNG